jgi:hypothetical protein
MKTIGITSLPQEKSTMKTIEINGKGMILGDYGNPSAAISGAPPLPEAEFLKRLARAMEMEELYRGVVANMRKILKEQGD